jgi:hypothetical protein
VQLYEAFLVLLAALAGVLGYLQPRFIASTRRRLGEPLQRLGAVPRNSSAITMGHAKVALC